MAQLLVRNLEADLVDRLKKRAARHGVSAEEEHRRILREVLMRPEETKPSLVEYLLGNEVAPDLEIEVERRMDPPRDIGL